MNNYITLHSIGGDPIYVDRLCFPSIVESNYVEGKRITSIWWHGTPISTHCTETPEEVISLFEKK